MNILIEADAATKARGENYGHPRDHLGNVARLWSEHLSYRTKQFIVLNARDVTMMMILLKVSRDANKPHRDDLVDIAGFARCAEMLEELS